MGWTRANKLKLNPGNTKTLRMSGSQVWEIGSLPVLDGVALPLKVQVHSLGVLLDPSLSLEAQVAQSAFTSFGWFTNYGLSWTLGHSHAGTTLTSRLDYCNALYVGLSSRLLEARVSAECSCCRELPLSRM